MSVPYSKQAHQRRRQHDLRHGGKITRLFAHRAGSVRAEVWGPRIGFQWRRVELFRYAPCTRQPGQWQRLSSWRTADLNDIGRCLDAVKKWQADHDCPAS